MSAAVLFIAVSTRLCSSLIQSSNCAPLLLLSRSSMGAVDDSGVSLRPLSLRPGGGAKPFSGFAFGAGMGLKHSAAMSSSVQYEKKKPRSEVVKYPRDFLMKFAPVNTRAPTELQLSSLELMLDPNDPEREAQMQALQRAAAEAGEAGDERDWRARTPLPPAPAPAAQRDALAGPAAANGPAPGAGPPSVPPTAGGGDGGAKIQRAADVGRTAWAAGAAQAAAEGTASLMRKVKGILNKLTPEKFERLLSQLIPLVCSYEMLQGTIHQVFENAVAQPTFVAMYAELCSELDAALPEFTPAAPGAGPQSFKKLLANTCQEEYEATEEARAAAAALGEDAVRAAKQRVMGNVRLISELFKKGMVNDRIMLLIMGELLGPKGEEPAEESLEAACELLTTAGAELESNARSRARLDAAFQQLTRLASSKSYAPRVRFIVRDVIELRAQHWVARRETFTAKKLDEIRTEAQAELGILDVSLPGMETIVPGLQPMPGLVAKRPDEVELFPAFRAADTAAGAAKAGGEGGKFSAFLGEYVPLPDASNATPPEAPGQAPRAPRTDLTPEARESLGKSLYSDYLASRDVGEAAAAAQELLVPGFGPLLVRLGVEKAFDTLVEAEQTAIADLVAELAARGALGADDVAAGVGGFASELEDIALDTPSAPRLLGRILGCAAAAGLLKLGVLAAQASGVESAEARRGFVCGALRAVQEAGGDDKLVAACKEAGLDAVKLLEHDPEFEGHLPSAEDFLKAQGLAALL